jgi:hypothetical protein
VPKRCHDPGLFLTAEEDRHVRNAMRNLRRQAGSWRALAEAMKMPVSTVRRAAETKSRPSLVLYLRAAQAGGISLEEMLRGGVVVAGRCARCGRSDPPQR